MTEEHHTVKHSMTYWMGFQDGFSLGVILVVFGAFLTYLWMTQ